MCDQSRISDTPYSDTAPNRRDVTLIPFNKSDSELNVVQQHQQMMQSLPWVMIENRKNKNNNKMVITTMMKMPNSDQIKTKTKIMSSKVQHPMARDKDQDQDQTEKDQQEQNGDDDDGRIQISTNQD